ncbi:MAG: sulfotransferase [Methylococcales bacterium]
MTISIEKILDEADALIAVFMYDQAIEKYNYILDQVGDCADALLMRGALLGELGHIDRAILDVEKSIVYDRENDSSFLTLAYLYNKKNNEKKAYDLCATAISLNKENKEAIKLFIQLSIKLGDEMLLQSVFNKAETYYENALQQQVGNASLLYKLVLVLRGKGEILNSIKMAEKVINVEPGHVRAKAHIASSYEILGEIDKGNELIEKLKCEYPDHPLVNIVYAQYSLRNKKQQQGISALNHIINNENISKYDSVSAKMLIGDLYDSIKDYDAAFKYYKQANDALDKNYDSESYKDYVSILIEYFSKEKYSSLPASENTSNELIFIVGMPRSGTSLIEQIISSHSSVFGAGELSNVQIMSNSLQEEEGLDNVYPVCLNEIDIECMEKMAKKLILSTMGNTNSLKVIDKMPHNFHHIGFIHKLLPNAKFINCERAPEDTCLSIYFKYFAGHHPYASNLHDLGVHYSEYERLMKHWMNELDIPVLTVKYENVVLDSKNEVEKILNFLDLEWEDSCMEFHKKKRVVATASYNQVNKKIYSSSIDRWKNYEQYLSELLDVLGKRH